MEKNNKKKKKLSEISKNILIPLIPPAVVACVVAPIAIVYGNRGGEEIQDVYKVTYEDCCPINPNSEVVEVDRNSNAYAIAPSTRDGYGFLGWKTVKNDESADYFDFDNTPIKSNLTLYGYWTQQTTKITLTDESDSPICCSASGAISWNSNFDSTKYDLPKHIVIPEKITTSNGNSIVVRKINDNGFSNKYGDFDGVESIWLPDTITSIGSGAFLYNNELKVINMPKGLMNLVPVLLMNVNH